MKCSKLALVAGLCVASAAIADPKTPQTMGNARQIQPIAAMTFTKDASGKIIPTSDWIQLGGISQRGSTLRYDGAQVVGGFPVTGQTCIDAGLPDGSRWFFGATYDNPHFATDYSMDDGAAAAGGDLDALDYAWFPNDTITPGGSWPFFLVTQAYSDYTDPNLGCDELLTFAGGVIFDFGLVPADGGGYYFTQITGLVDAGIVLPITPNGYIEVIHAEEFDPVAGTVTFPFSYVSQPMLHGTPEDRSETGPGISGAAQWDDDAPLDGLFDGTVPECYDYTFGVCPDPLGACLSIYTNGGGCPSADFNGDGFTDFFDYDDYVACFEGAGAPGCNADFNGDGFVDFFDYDAFVFAFEGCP
jgi:hypothetical protein